MKRKSLRQLARELEVSPSYLSMILNGQRKCPEKLQGALYSFTNVHNAKLSSAWTAGTLPTELLPQSTGHSKPDVSVCQSRISII
jgi:transcriptional regulator with XRE-family HTH domain